MYLLIHFVICLLSGSFKHEENNSNPNSPQMRGRPRVKRPPLMSQPHVMGSPLPSPHPPRKQEMYRSTSLETRSRTPSPNPTPTSTPMNEYYGTSNLTDRSRSPSPSLSSPVNTPPKRSSRKLPVVPQPHPTKPSTLNLAQPKLKENMPRVMPSPTIPQPSKSPGSINFPKLNPSPTHKPKLNIVSVPHNIPPPGKLGRPEPYSPTERNNLNKITDPRDHLSQSRSLPLYGKRGEPKSNIPQVDQLRRINHSPDINRLRRESSERTRTRPSARSFEEPNQLSYSPGGASIGRGRGELPPSAHMGSNQSHAQSPSQSRSPRSVRATSNVPNGVKRRNGRKPEKLELRSDSNVPLTQESDEDEDDWC